MVGMQMGHQYEIERRGLDPGGGQSRRIIGIQILEQGVAAAIFAIPGGRIDHD